MELLINCAMEMQFVKQIENLDIKYLLNINLAAVMLLQTHYQECMKKLKYQYFLINVFMVYHILSVFSAINVYYVLSVMFSTISVYNVSSVSFRVLLGRSIK